jgi:putative DNA primase/helicase
MNAIEQQLASVMPEVFADQGAPVGPATAQGATIGVGERNATLARVAGRLRHLGLPAETIAAALHVENRRLCPVPLSDFEVEQIARSIGKYPTPQAQVPLFGLSLERLAGHAFPDRKALLTRDDTAVLCAGHIGQIYAERGFGKSWFIQTLALTAAAGSEALGFRAPEPCRVALFDGEMASLELKDRFSLLCDRLNIPFTAALTIIAADWQENFMPRLDTPAGQVAAEPFVEHADLVILDNRSCLFDPESEKDPSAWQPAQDWLLSLRRRGKAVLVAHHSNRQGGARGHSKPEDMMNVLIKLSRPEDYSQEQGARFIATFDKCRGAYGSAVAPFAAHLTVDGWRIEGIESSGKSSVSDRLVEYVRLAHQAGERAKSANAAIVGAKVQKAAGLAAWADLKERGVIRQHSEGGFYAVS